ncbi:MAG TPA: CehA/McbA family metallohydrolase [Thermoleophilaceae bacterium]|nr:CehA/McbA family metallohydrolase [Thermoleophilaceae bacterium]
MHDLACVVHLHSTYSDGTGTVEQIVRAARQAEVDVVLLTDHDTLGAKHDGKEGWHGSVLLLVGEEISPVGRDHYLAFGTEEHTPHSGRTAAEICQAVRDAGGFGFAAHPWSRGSERFRRPGMAFGDLEAADGIELWSFATDTAERLPSVRAALSFIAAPGRTLDHPPEENVRAWDELCARRRTPAIGGLDAHQFGKRIGPVVPIRLMSYRRSFAQIRTHVLCDESPSGELERDRAQVLAALREGRSYIAVDALAPARGFRFWAEGPEGDVPLGADSRAGRYSLHAVLPGPARLRLLRDGREIASREAPALVFDVDEPGVYRVEARLERHGRERTWVISNPVYLR